MSATQKDAKRQIERISAGLSPDEIERRLTPKFEPAQAIELNRVMEPVAARLREESYAPTIEKFPVVGGRSVVLAELRRMIEELDQ